MVENQEGVVRKVISKLHVVGEKITPTLMVVSAGRLCSSRVICRYLLVNSIMLLTSLIYFEPGEALLLERHFTAINSSDTQ